MDADSHEDDAGACAARLVRSALDAMCEAAVAGPARWAMRSRRDAAWTEVRLRLSVAADATVEARIVVDDPVVRLYAVRTASAAVCAGAAAAMDGVDGVDGVDVADVADDVGDVDVLVGFGLDAACPVPAVDVDVVMTVRNPFLGAVWSARKRVRLDREAVLVPAWMRTTLLPLCAVPHIACINLTLPQLGPHEPPAQVVHQRAHVYAVFAQLRPHDVGPAFVACAADIHLPYADGLLAVSASDATDAWDANADATANADADADATRRRRRRITLPDLELMLETHPLSCRTQRARDRARARCALVFKELMEAAWAPARVRSGAIELD
jgi:hypothetical protein